MNLRRAWVLVGLLWLAACSPGIWPISVEATQPAPATLPTQTPTLAFPPKPTPLYTPQVFPSCQADPLPALQLAPLPSPAANLAPADPSAAPTLRSLAERRGVLIGAAADTAYFSNPGYTALLARQFNLLTPENAFNWDNVHPEMGRYDFSQGDALAVYARANGLAVYGYALVWDQHLPNWLTAETRSREAWIQLLCRHVKTVVGRYRGQVYAWNVVNEPFQNDGHLRNTLWMRVIGPEYIGMAFQWAREADPDALLILNEHSAEGLNEKSQAVYAFVEGLLRQGLPIDGVGLQMHVWLWGPPTKDELLANMRRLAQLGLQAHITAMDVRTQYTQDSRQQELAVQAETYRQALAGCLSAPNCNVFITWGLTDSTSSIPELTGTPDIPLLFDEAGAAKPAFDAILGVLKNAP
jgi:endo-1,4-beta-xylanase